MILAAELAMAHLPRAAERPLAGVTHLWQGLTVVHSQGWVASEPWGVPQAGWVGLQVPSEA